MSPAPCYNNELLVFSAKVIFKDWFWTSPARNKKGGGIFSSVGESEHNHAETNTNYSGSFLARTSSPSPLTINHKQKIIKPKGHFEHVRSFTFPTNCTSGTREVTGRRSIPLSEQKHQTTLRMSNAATAFCSSPSPLQQQLQPSRTPC